MGGGALALLRRHGAAVFGVALLVGGAVLGASVGTSAGREACVVGATLGSLDADPLARSRSCSVHGGAVPVTPEGVGSKRTQP